MYLSYPTRLDRLGPTLLISKYVVVLRDVHQNRNKMTNEEARDQLQLRTGGDQLRTRGGGLANVPALLFRFVVSKSQAFASISRYGYSWQRSAKLSWKYEMTK